MGCGVSKETEEERLRKDSEERARREEEEKKGREEESARREAEPKMPSGVPNLILNPDAKDGQQAWYNNEGGKIDTTKCCPNFCLDACDQVTLPDYFCDDYTPEDYTYTPVARYWRSEAFEISGGQDYSFTMCYSLTGTGTMQARVRHFRSHITSKAEHFVGEHAINLQSTGGEWRWTEPIQGILESEARFGDVYVSANWFPPADKYNGTGHFTGFCYKAQAANPEEMMLARREVDLRKMKRKELEELAKASGLPEQNIQAADEKDNPKEAFVRLILDAEFPLIHLGGHKNGGLRTNKLRAVEQDKKQGEVCIRVIGSRLTEANGVYTREPDANPGRRQMKNGEPFGHCYRKMGTNRTLFADSEGCWCLGKNYEHNDYDGGGGYNAESEDDMKEFPWMCVFEYPEIKVIPEDP